VAALALSGAAAVEAQGAQPAAGGNAPPVAITLDEAIRRAEASDPAYV